MAKEYIELNCIEVNQPIGSFYIAKIDVIDLIKISFADIRKIEKETDNVLGIQRELSPKRVGEISKYVRNKDATFPTSIILSINSNRISNLSDPEKMNIDENEEQDEDSIITYVNGILTILKTDNVAKIIDGYHRVAGLGEPTDWNRGEFELNVTIFKDMDPEDEAIVFATINKAQTKPSNSLAYDLYELAKSRSPQKTAHNIARLFNKETGNPFYRKIKILGKSIYDSETISQATFVEALMAHISSDPMKDRDTLKREKALFNDEKEQKRHIFRQLFINKQDELIAVILSNYFEAVKIKWEDAWNDRISDMVLNRTTGFIALMKYLKHAYNTAQKEPNYTVKTENFSLIFNRIDIRTQDLNKNIYKPGGSGIAHLYKDLMFKQTTNN